MKHLFATAISVLILCPIVAPPIHAAKRAVVVAVEQYKEDGFNNLSGCINDGNAIVDILKTHLGFSDSEIRYLRDREATRRGILDAFDWLAAETKPADKVFFYYAGHGYYIADDNSDEKNDKDEKKPNDETICPYDTDPRSIKDPRRKGNMVIDDDIGEKLVGLKGRKIVMIFDSCHSGTATRGIGGPTRPVRSLPLHKAQPRFRSIGTIRKDADIPKSIPRVNAMSEEIDRGESFMVFLAAAAAHEQAQEIPEEKHGALTYSLMQAFNQKGKGTCITDAKTAYDALTSQYGFLDYQTPQIEGNPALAGTSLFEIFNATEGQTIAQAAHNDPPAVDVSLSASTNGRTGTDFTVGDPVRFHFTANDDGYLYLFDYIEATGDMYLLFPNQWSYMGRGSEANRVRRNQTVLTPPDKVKGVPVNFELYADQPGTERIIAILTKTPWPEMNAIVGENNAPFKQMTDAQKMNLMELMARKQSERGLEFDPGDQAWGPGEWAGTSVTIRIH